MDGNNLALVVAGRCDRVVFWMCLGARSRRALRCVGCFTAHFADRSRRAEGAMGHHAAWETDRRRACGNSGSRLRRGGRNDARVHSSRADRRRSRRLPQLGAVSGGVTIHDERAPRLVPNRGARSLELRGATVVTTTATGRLNVYSGARLQHSGGFRPAPARPSTTTLLRVRMGFKDGPVGPWTAAVRRKHNGTLDPSMSLLPERRAVCVTCGAGKGRRPG